MVSSVWLAVCWRALSCNNAFFDNRPRRLLLTAGFRCHFCVFCLVLPTEYGYCVFALSSIALFTMHHVSKHCLRIAVWLPWYTLKVGERVTYQKLVTLLRYGLVRCAEMYEAAASCKVITRTPVTNWEPQCLTLAGYCYAVRHGMKVQLVTPYRVSHLQRYGVTARGNVTSVYPP